MMPLPLLHGNFKKILMHILMINSVLLTDKGTFSSDLTIQLIERPNRLLPVLEVGVLERIDMVIVEENYCGTSPTPASMILYTSINDQKWLDW